MVTKWLLQFQTWNEVVKKKCYQDICPFYYKIELSQKPFNKFPLMVHSLVRLWSITTIGCEGDWETKVFCSLWNADKASTKQMGTDIGLAYQHMWNTCNFYSVRHRVAKLRRYSKKFCLPGFIIFFIYFAKIHIKATFKLYLLIFLLVYWSDSI